MLDEIKTKLREYASDYKLEPIVSIKPHGIVTETAQKTTNDVSDVPFVKYDENKPLMSLIEPKFIIELGKLLTFGANKYEKDNWKKCDDVSRYKDALLRHTFAYLNGEIVDPESRIEHTIAIAFNTMALQYFDNLQ